jgi:uroporphyrinogen-III synthase
MIHKIENILDSLNLIYYEYNKNKKTLFVDESGLKDDVGREFIKITYTLTKNEMEFFIDSEKNIIIACQDKFFSRLKHKFNNVINKIKNNNKKIYILSDKKVKYATNLPVINMEYMTPATNLEEYDALIFTSQNAIKAIDSMNPSWKKIPSYVIAPQTAKIVKSLGGTLTFIGQKKNGDEFAQEICETLKGQKVLYIGGTKIVSNLINILNDSGVVCDNLPIYKTVCKKYETKITLPKHSIIIFSSPSTIECFLKNINWSSTFKAVSIGKTTAKYFPEYIKPYISETTSLDSCVQKAQELN